MGDYTRIYLQPECCTDPAVGRLWCEEPDPEECDDGKNWSRYFSQEAVQKAIKEELAEWTGDYKKPVAVALKGIWARLDTIYP